MVPILSKMHEMVSDRCSRADVLTNLREISMRVSFNANDVEKSQYGHTKTQQCRFSRTHLLEATHLIPNNIFSDILYLNIIKLIIYN